MSASSARPVPRSGSSTASVTLIQSAVAEASNEPPTKSIASAIESALRLAVPFVRSWAVKAASPTRSTGSIALPPPSTARMVT